MCRVTAYSRVPMIVLLCMHEMQIKLRPTHIIKPTVHYLPNTKQQTDEVGDLLVKEILTSGVSSGPDGAKMRLNIGLTFVGEPE